MSHEIILLINLSSADVNRGRRSLPADGVVKTSLEQTSPELKRTC